MNARKPDTDRLPPHSVEAEAGVLACCFQAAECVGDAAERIKDARAFYDLRNRMIFETMLELDRERIAVDLLTVLDRLKQRGLLEQVGEDHLNGLPDQAPSAANLSYYVDIVQEKFLLRRWIQLCTETVAQIYDCEGPTEELSARISGELFKLCEVNQAGTVKSMREVWVEVNEQFISKFRRGVKHKIGPMTGFNYLDNILPGLGAGQLVVLAARPRTGKSAMMMQIAEHIAMVEKMPVAVFSLEMSAVSLGARAVFQRAGADMTKFLNGFMSDDDAQKLVAAGAQLSGLGIHIDEAPRLAIEDLEIRARRMVRRLGVRVIFVDYFQLLYVRNRHKQWSKADELAECSMRLKGLAKELSVPIFLCAQMNREIERETHRRPRLADLRDTGQLEQDADVVMFLWKPDVKIPPKPPLKPMEPAPKLRGWEKRLGEILPRLQMVPEDWRKMETWRKELAIVTCTVEKQREGRSGEDATLVFIKPWTRFVDAYTAPKPGEPASEPSAPEEETGSEE